MGFLSDKYSPWLLGSITHVATSLATFLLWGIAATNLAGLIAYGVFFGLLASGWTSTWTGFIRPISGTLSIIKRGGFDLKEAYKR